MVKDKKQSTLDGIALEEGDIRAPYYRDISFLLLIWVSQRMIRFYRAFGNKYYVNSGGKQAAITFLVVELAIFCLKFTMVAI